MTPCVVCPYETADRHRGSRIVTDLRWVTIIKVAE